MGAVLVNNIGKSFGKVDVIKDVSITVEPGEFCVLIGPSGSGKSTILRLIAGLEEATTGAIHIGGRDVTRLPPKQRDIAMVFQTYALYPQMTVAENMGFALRLSGMRKTEIAEKVKAAAKLLELDQLLDRLPKELSGGQRQRVSMGRAIVRNPTVFLFDEPLSNLDAKLRAQVRGEIADLHKRLKTTSIYVTHDQIEAMTLGQKIVVLRNGRVEQIGRPMDLYNEPANVFVAGFIGTPSINLLHGRVRVNGTTKAVELSDGSHIPIKAGFDVTANQKVVLGLRPEHLTIAARPDAEGISVKVTAIENTGSDMVVNCEKPGLRLVAAFKEQRSIEVGQAVTIVPDHGKACLFDCTTERHVPFTTDA
ncbi:ABC transporter ATP-binding protein [Roseinatronobacter alkalisoli]|uniref:Sn-glycerol-3-phosphate ABC transporter ATP-binding protein UgpC n=1 Tax=Roseinatronobacter alkalisoli TaxID=3028235 RepID=A0ABT5TFS8_9RHOB|nr:sn-glycerol-3-phosphate ABC transporter ATP-binding protein UgpC [Roseinatronobacter sp. HJB301]MDD7973520.1 sn-glycerol-3-phosphate ABC transporter ATP-binding protein UgpC [Roseinatronobacter sp. HJB301]